MNYGMELCLQSPNPRLINWGSNLGTLSSWDVGNMLMLLEKAKWLGEHADGTGKSQMMMGVSQTTMSKGQLNFFTFQSISEVLKSSISLSAFTVIIDHQREEESIALLEEIDQHYMLCLSLLNVSLHVCMLFLELLSRWSSKLLLIIFIQIYIRPYKASVFWMLFCLVTLSSFKW